MLRDRYAPYHDENHVPAQGFQQTLPFLLNNTAYFKYFINKFWFLPNFKLKVYQNQEPNKIHKSCIQKQNFDLIKKKEESRAYAWPLHVRQFNNEIFL